jgi:hypothetical protein
MKTANGISFSAVGYNVHVREYGGAYVARCEGMRASCTRTREEAARKAAAKALNRSGQFKRKVTDDDVTLQGVAGGDIFFASFTETERSMS